MTTEQRLYLRDTEGGPEHGLVRLVAGPGGDLLLELSHLEDLETVATTSLYLRPVEAETFRAFLEADG